MKNLYISYGSGLTGYRVQVIRSGRVESEYSAGNNRHDSQVWLPAGHDNAVSPAQLAKFARQTALEMADERGIPHDCVGYDPDLDEEDE